MSNRAPIFRLTVLDRSGAIVQHVPMSSEPDGIAFHAVTPEFVVTSDTDGTVTRFDFPGDDFTMPPVQSVFASGGFRGDLSQVGGDGCLYLTQDGTRFDDGTTSGSDSIVRICQGFVPPPGVSTTTTSSSTSTSTSSSTSSTTSTSTTTTLPLCAAFPCGRNGTKVTICHFPPGNPGNAQTLCISQDAVPAHLMNHGDFCGPCR